MVKKRREPKFLSCSLPLHFQLAALTHRPGATSRRLTRSHTSTLNPASIKGEFLIDLLPHFSLPQSLIPLDFTLDLPFKNSHRIRYYPILSLRSNNSSVQTQNHLWISLSFDSRMDFSMKATGAQLWLIRSNYSLEHSQAQLYPKNCIRAAQFKEIDILRKLAVSRLLPLSYSSVSAATLSANDLNSFDTQTGTETKKQNRYHLVSKDQFWILRLNDLRNSLESAANGRWDS